MNVQLVRRVLARSSDLQLLHAASDEEGIALAVEGRPEPARSEMT